MEYSATFEGEFYTLPAYSFEIADKLNRADNGNGTLRERCNRIYNTCSEIMGKDKVAGILGSFEKVDPNRVMILFDAVKEAYTEPVLDKTMERVNEKLKASGISNLTEVLDKVDRIKANNNKG